MASLIYCINHPKHPDEKFFFIQNTFLEFQGVTDVFYLNNPLTKAALKVNL